ncbi:hypothetical protein [Aquiflexum sp.]|uniref:hypothetical protein n=1 Tax=Aquiflexum sp. TaxID=1872584 RepID=UPI00359310E9
MAMIEQAGSARLGLNNNNTDSTKKGGLSVETLTTAKIGGSSVETLTTAKNT